MVSVWRYRPSGNSTLDRSVGRNRRRCPCPVGRCNRRPCCTALRAKRRVFQRRVLAICTTLKCLQRARVVARKTVQGLPGDGVPTRFIGPVTLHCFVNEPRVQQFALRLAEHVSRLPAPALHVGARQQQSPVVVAHELTRHFQQQRPSVHRQTAIRGAIPRRPPKVLHLWPPKLLHPGRGDLTH
jgi:hypothetical protein